LTEGAWADAYKTYSQFRDLARILAEARRHKLQYGLDLLVLDFIQNVTVGGHGQTSEYETIGAVMKAMQQMAQIEECTVLLLSQTAIEQQKGLRNTDALNAKGGGVVKDTADVALSLFRDRFADGDARHIMQATVLKAKEHSTGIVSLWMNFDTGRLHQRDEQHQSQEYTAWLSEQRR
jgi:replicative DNA helicase